MAPYFSCFLFSAERARVCVCVCWLVGSAGASSASTHWCRLAMTKCVVCSLVVFDIQWRLRSYSLFNSLLVQVCVGRSPLFTQANHYSGPKQRVFRKIGTVNEIHNDFSNYEMGVIHGMQGVCVCVVLMPLLAPEQKLPSTMRRARFATVSSCFFFHVRYKHWGMRSISCRSDHRLFHFITNEMI